MGIVMPNKMKRAVELLSELGAAALAPVKLQGRWKRAPVSRRRAATLRKQAIVDGKYGNTSIENGGWDPSWDQPRDIFPLRPNKTHQRERDRVARAAKVTQALEGMEQRVAKHREEKLKLKPVPGIESLIKRFSKKK